MRRREFMGGAAALLAGVVASALPAWAVADQGADQPSSQGQQDGPGHPADAEAGQGDAAWPLHFERTGLEYPDDAVPVQPEVPEACQTLDELVRGFDTVIFLSDADNDEMTFFSLGEDLLAEAKADSEALVAKVLQASLLGHNFHGAYNDAHLDEGLLGFRGAIDPAYATVATDEEESLPVMGYEFYRNCLQPRSRDLQLVDLPLFSDDQAQGRPWLQVSNSEQLVFAAQYGYRPWCVPGSGAEEILARCVEALSWITGESMSQTQLWRAIYQYVLLSTHYDYTTLLDIYQREPSNRAFFLEGAVLDGHAVCDGMCKELVLMARLMGLEAWHVGARGETDGHAYVYVRADGEWYLSCPTYGSQRYTRKDGRRQDYHTCNYCLTDFDTNMEGWTYDADVLEDVERELREQSPYDYWSQTTVEVGGARRSLHPESVEEALALLVDAQGLQQQLGMPVEVELCGSVRVLRDAYTQLKEACDDVVYLSGGTFEGQRLQVYILGAQA